MTSALIVVDVQNDFCPGGNLAVPQGDEIVGPINDLMRQSSNVILTQDWHPQNHRSFASQHPGMNPFEMTSMAYGLQILWPDHCVQNSHGAEFHKDLELHHADLILRKGTNPDIDSYSAFLENDKRTLTGLDGYLRARDTRRLTFVGLATDFCVAWSAIDAAKAGYDVTVRLDLCRAIDTEGSLDVAISEMQSAGVTLA